MATQDDLAAGSGATALLMMACLLGKHFICDFVLQTSYQAQNKGRYGHPAGLIHAALHGLGSALVLAFLAVAPVAIVAICVVETVVHYHIDWIKQAISIRAGWTPADSAFWIAIGADQLAHQATYVAMTAAAMSPGLLALLL